MANNNIQVGKQLLFTICELYSITNKTKVNT
ncbi:hypothetical protein CLV42_11581 [Chitinophaga ginsengisoli]|uniref:Uncharacterized protein n=1 Tax=Chitinophaga ginsengisoli TaxID=363837 RepID=A0A2P8FRZ2_9BACT|nr:hypothetical protein CLV42_11581 [Chitinophaga ginsengisoli]